MSSTISLFVWWKGLNAFYFPPPLCTIFTHVQRQFTATQLHWTQLLVVKTTFSRKLIFKNHGWMVFYKGVSDTNASDNCIFHQTHNIHKNGNFKFILTRAFLKNFVKKKKTVVVFYKKSLLWHFKGWIFNEHNKSRYPHINQNLTYTSFLFLKYNTANRLSFS